MATLNASFTTGTTPSPGHDAPSLPPDISSPSTPSDSVTKDSPAAPSNSDSMRPSEPGGQPLESGCGLVPPKEIGEPREEPGCGGFPPKDLGVGEDKQQEEEGGLPPVDLRNHLLFTAGGEACLVAKLSLPGASELLLPKGFSWGEGCIKEESSLSLLAHSPPAHLTVLHIQHGFDPIQGFSSSDQILSHDTSAPSPAALDLSSSLSWHHPHHQHFADLTVSPAYVGCSRQEDLATFSRIPVGSQAGLPALSTLLLGVLAMARFLLCVLTPFSARCSNPRTRGGGQIRSRRPPDPAPIWD